VKMDLIRLDGVPHIRGPLLGRSRCGENFTPSNVERPLLHDVCTSDICRKCFHDWLTRPVVLPEAGKAAKKKSRKKGARA